MFPISRSEPLSQAGNYLSTVRGNTKLPYSICLSHRSGGIYIVSAHLIYQEALVVVVVVGYIPTTYTPLPLPTRYICIHFEQALIYCLHA